MSKPLTLRLSAALWGVSLILTACGGDDTTAPPVPHLYFSQDNNANGLFEVDLATGAATLVGSGITGVTAATVGLTGTGNAATLLASQPFAIAAVNADGSGATPIVGSEVAEGLALNTTTGILYATINGTFFSVNTTTGVKVADLAPPGVDIEGIAADPETNRVYGIGDDDNLYVYSVATGMWSTVGNTGRNWNQGGLAYDHLANVLYGIGGPDDNLYTINTSTATPTLIGALGTTADGGLAFVVE